MRRYRLGGVGATGRDNDVDERPFEMCGCGQGAVSLLAHGGAGAINTWGFAYVGGDHGLFSMSLLYVKAKVAPPVTTPGRVPISHRVAAIGPVAIMIGGVCGVSFGLGLAGVLDGQFFVTAEVSEVVDDLCELRTPPAGPLRSELHDDINHVITDLDVADAEAAHLSLHAAAASSATPQPEWHRAIDDLVDLLNRADGSPQQSCADRSAR